MTFSEGGGGGGEFAREKTGGGTRHLVYGSQSRISIRFWQNSNHVVSATVALFFVVFPYRYWHWFHIVRLKLNINAHICPFQRIPLLSRFRIVYKFQGFHRSLNYARPEWSPLGFPTRIPSLWLRNPPGNILYVGIQPPAITPSLAPLINSHPLTAGCTVTDI